MKKLLLTLILLSLYGCVTPPEQLTDDDFIIKRYSITEPTLISMERYREGYRHCGEKYGIPECALSSTTGKAVCDVYGQGHAGSRSILVIGRIDMTPIATGTDVEIRTLDAFWLRNKPNLIETWKLYIAGDYDKACPIEPVDDSTEEDAW